MSDRDIATPTFYLVLQRQRSESELPRPALHQPHQGGKTALISGKRLDELTLQLGGHLPLNWDDPHD